MFVKELESPAADRPIAPIRPEIEGLEDSRIVEVWKLGFEIPDEFVVGYGMDYLDAHRNLPYVAALEPCDLSGEARP